MNRSPESFGSSQPVDRDVSSPDFMIPESREHNLDNWQDQEALQIGISSLTRRTGEPLTPSELNKVEIGEGDEVFLDM